MTFNSTSEVMRIAKEHADLTIENDKYEFPVVRSTVGPDGVFVSPMRNESYVILDPGFLTTAQCESKITFIDGNEGILRYRGYDIDDLTSNAWYLEVAYLLINGYLPNENQLNYFVDSILKNIVVGEDVHAFINAMPKNSNPMAMLAAGINALEMFHPETIDINDEEQVNKSIVNILAKIRTLTALIMRRTQNEPLFYADHTSGFVSDFMRLCFAKPFETYVEDPVMIDALDKILIIQADHEQNCSTSVLRITGSTNATLYASVASGINALSGSLHGGANREAFEQIQTISKLMLNENKTMREILDDYKRDGKKIAGFGHRVYKTYDPRAQIAKKCALNIYNSSTNNFDKRYLELAIELEELVLNDEYFIERKLFPNLDFWTCLVYNSIGFNKRMFTPLFALARSAGWISHWKEMRNDPMTKIGRPRQVYSGNVHNVWKSINERN